MKTTNRHLFKVERPYEIQDKKGKGSFAQCLQEALLRARNAQAVNRISGKRQYYQALHRLQTQRDFGDRENLGVLA